DQTLRHDPVDPELHQVAMGDAEDHQRALHGNAADHLAEGQVPELPVLTEMSGAARIENQLRRRDPEEARILSHERPRLRLQILEGEGPGGSRPGDAGGIERIPDAGQPGEPLALDQGQAPGPAVDIEIPAVSRRALEGCDVVEQSRAQLALNPG